MGDAFLLAQAVELEQTQRAFSPHCLFCVPQACSLLTDEVLTQDVLYTHFLTPADTNEYPERRLGVYNTLNGKELTLLGSHLHTGKGFNKRRKVRVLLIEKRQLQCQEITVLHLSRPLEGGIQVPEDPSELDIATLRKYTAILRSFPENELVFYHLNETIGQVRKICAQDQVYERYEQILSKNVREEWEAGVEELLHAQSFEIKDDKVQNNGHLLQIQQVVECYLMENLHDSIFQRIVTNCQDQDKKLRQVLYHMRHYTPQDFGLREAFQCYTSEARDILVTVTQKKTPLDMLLVFKACIDRIEEAITRNVKLRRLDFESYQLTTDDILDQLLFLFVQVYNLFCKQGKDWTSFPIVAILKYISDYHFINSSTTALGFTIANFQVAIEYFLLRGDETTTVGIDCSNSIKESLCSQAATKLQQEFMQTKENLERLQGDSGASTGQDNSPQCLKMKVSIIGEWSSFNELADDGPLNVHPVEFLQESESSIVQISSGQRFFALVTQDGSLFTWGDSSGGRLGYSLADGESRRVACPQRVVSLQKQTILHVACGAFHTVATDLNGHVFAWGNNSRRQLGFKSSTVVIPSLVQELRGVYMSSVACGEYHSLTLSADGRVFSWGCNKYGKLGRLTKTMVDTTPGEIVTDWTGWTMDMKRLNATERSRIRRIAAGKDHSLAITSDGAGFTWGRGDAGQLGHGSYMNVSEPNQVMSISSSRLIDIAGGTDFSLFLFENGTVSICGRDPSQDLDKLELTAVLLILPLALREFFGQIAAVSCGERHFALLSKSGSILLSYSNFSQKVSNAGSTTGEMQERRVICVEKTGIVHRMDCGGSHTLILA